MKTKKVLRILLAVSTVFGLSPTQAMAGWTVTYLNPAGAHNSSGLGVYAGQQVGQVNVQAALWNSTAETWVSLNPPGSVYSYAWAVADGEQVGCAAVGIDPYNGNIYHAGYWKSTAASWVDLNPNWADSSCAQGASNGQQVGYVSLRRYLYLGDYRWIYNWYPHASLWSGSASSCVDLNPSYASASWARDVSDGQQVGGAYFGSLDAYNGFVHASLWRGTADSWVDLNPAGATGSGASGVSAGRQVGGATFVGPDGQERGHAGMWSGTAASWIDLNPVGADSSDALAISDDVEVGLASFDGNEHAGLWTGSASSWRDLSVFLQPGIYKSSCAYSVYASNGNVWVVGQAVRVSDNEPEAILWQYVVPEPTGLLALLCGIVSLAGGYRLRRRAQAQERSEAFQISEE